MFKFVGTTSDGLPQKRSQSLRACPPCRRRKKRCIHASAQGNDAPVMASSPRACSFTPQSVRSQFIETRDQTALDPDQDVVYRSAADSTPEVVDAESETDSNGEHGDRFIGDLNPESIFLAATSPQTTFSPGGSNVGIWIPRKALEGFRKCFASNASGNPPSPDPLLSNILLPYMQRQCQQLLPPIQQYLALHKIYVHEIHPIFPIFDLESLDDTALLDVTANMILVKQAICLAASTSPRAAKCLQLISSDDSSSINDVGHFTNRLTTAIRTTIDMGFVTDRIVIVQVLTTLALFTQFSRQSNLSAEITARAVSHAQTIGLHLDIPNTRKNHDYLTRLFCCVWTLDKLNAAFQGRPTLMHEHDFGRNLAKAIMVQGGCFRLLLRITAALDSTISLYRPAQSDRDCSVSELPSFEDLIHECDALKVASNLLATVELLYHAVVILSCRSKSPMLGNSPLELRATLSATSITFITGTEFREHVSHLPFVPYALSLSLRVFYRELRFNSKSPFSRNRARKQLLNACTMLRESFAINFPATVKVAELAEHTVAEMEKVYNCIRQQHGRSRSVSVVADRNNHTASAAGPATDVHEPNPAPGEQRMTSLNIDAAEEFSDLDVFDFFDADFELDAIDAALIDNLALAMPMPLDPDQLSQGIV